jgi:hypothetical protein
VRILIVRSPTTADRELAEAVCRGASLFAAVRIRTIGDVSPEDAAACDVLVVAAPSGARRSAVESLLAEVPASGARVVVIAARAGRRLSRNAAFRLARRLRRRSVALLIPPRTFRLDPRLGLSGDEWERARDLGEDIVVAAGGTIKLERLLPDPV